MANTDTKIRSKRQRAAAEAQERRQQAARREIRTVGDPVLREQAGAVTVFDDRLAALARRMIRVMQAAPGVGLAAPQVGVVRRLIVYEAGEDGPRALVNPVITWRSEETETCDEGCLSVPDVTVPVERALMVRVEANDLTGSRLTFAAEDMEARVIQHEVDHLDGILILQRTSRGERARALRELRESALR